MTAIFFDRLSESLPTAGFQHVSCDGVEAAYRGTPYLPGFTIGEDSVLELLRRSENRSLEQLCQELRGVFGICIHDRRTGRLHSFVDNCGLYKLYHDGRCVSFGFLELLDTLPGLADRIDDEKLVEYIAHGIVAGTETMVKGVRVLSGAQILTVSRADEGRDVRVQLTEKAFSEPRQSVGELFTALPDELEVALRDSNLSADITGGLDTRLLVALLSGTDLDYELAVSGRSDSNDVRIAGRIAEVLGRELKALAHVVPTKAEQLDAEILQIHQEGDGQTDAVRSHRLMQLTRARVERGVNVAMHGGGGDLYKDSFFLQDFPFYGNRPPNFERLYKLRISPLSTRYLWTPEGSRMAETARENLLTLYRSTGEQTNVRAYIAAYGRFRSPAFFGREYTNRINLGLGIIAPYLERHHLRAGLDMPIRSRLLNGWHRAVIDRLNPELAALQTTETYRAVSGPRFALQLPRYAITQGRRVFKKIMQRTVGKSIGFELGADANNDRNLYAMARQCPSVKEAIVAMKERGLFRPDLDIVDISNLHLGRAVTAGLLLNRSVAGRSVR